MATVGIAGIGIYLPEGRMTAKEIAEETEGLWSEQAVMDKLGIVTKTMPGKNDGTQEMGALAAIDAMRQSGIEGKDIDVVLCIGEEWKEYPLTTSALYLQHRVGAENAWGIDLANRCCTSVSTLKIAKDMLLADDEINTILVAGGYRNSDLVDFTDGNMSMMYNLGAGGGAVILKKNHKNNELLGSHIIGDGSLARTAGVEIGGTCHPITPENYQDGNKLRLMDPEKMKNRLNKVSMDNWYRCIDRALEKSGYDRSDIDYLSVLHMKRSGHLQMLKTLGLKEEQSIFLEDYGHIGQIDQILSLKLAIDQGKVREGSVVCMVAAGIGYVWAANVIKWGKIGEK